MEEFNTLEKVEQLFENVGCKGNENCYYRRFMEKYELFDIKID